MKTTTNYSWKEIDEHIHSDPTGIALISITGVTEKTEWPKYANWHSVLQITFDDVLPNGNSPRYKGKYPIVHGYEPMQEAHAERIAAFIRDNWNHSIHVHCLAGISRSAAVAAVLSAMGWKYITPEMREFGISYANQHVISLLKQQFPFEFALIGQ